jgi:hypothetical protein
MMSFKTFSGRISFVQSQIEKHKMAWRRWLQKLHPDFITVDAQLKKVDFKEAWRDVESICQAHEERVEEFYATLANLMEEQERKVCEQPQ